MSDEVAQCAICNGRGDIISDDDQCETCEACKGSGLEDYEKEFDESLDYLPSNSK